MYAYKTNINDHFIHLFVMRRSSKQLLLKNHEVFIMNFIYKTNKKNAFVDYQRLDSYEHYFLRRFLLLKSRKNE